MCSEKEPEDVMPDDVVSAGAASVGGSTRRMLGAAGRDVLGDELLACGASWIGVPLAEGPSSTESALDISLTGTGDASESNRRTSRNELLGTTSG